MASLNLQHAQFGKMCLHTIHCTKPIEITKEKWRCNKYSVDSGIFAYDHSEYQIDVEQVMVSAKSLELIIVGNEWASLIFLIVLR